MNTYNRHRFPPGIHSQLLGAAIDNVQAEVYRWLSDQCSQLHMNQGRAFKITPQNSRADLLLNWGSKGAHPGVETPITPDEPDVLDSGGGVWKGVG